MPLAQHPRKAAIAGALPCKQQSEQDACLAAICRKIHRDRLILQLLLDFRPRAGRQLPSRCDYGLWAVGMRQANRPAQQAVAGMLALALVFAGSAQPAASSRAGTAGPTCSRCGASQTACSCPCCQKRSCCGSKRSSMDRTVSAVSSRGTCQCQKMPYRPAKPVPVGTSPARENEFTVPLLVLDSLPAKPKCSGPLCTVLRPGPPRWAEGAQSWLCRWLT